MGTEEIFLMRGGRREGGREGGRGVVVMRMECDTPGLVHDGRWVMVVMSMDGIQEGEGGREGGRERREERAVGGGKSW